MQTTQLEYTTLPGLKEGFGVDDIISIGVTAGLKKAMNDKIHDTIGLISQSTPTVIKYQANLDEFQPLADNIAMLGDLLNFYKQKALMLVLLVTEVSTNATTRLLTVHAFNAADVKWSDDGTLAQVQAIVDMVGMAIIYAVDLVIPEVGIFIHSKGNANALSASSSIFAAHNTYLTVYSYSVTSSSCFRRRYIQYYRIVY